MLKGVNGKPVAESDIFPDINKDKWIPIRKTHKIAEDKSIGLEEKKQALRLDLYEGGQGVVAWVNNFGAKNSNEFINGFHFHCDSFIHSRYANRDQSTGVGADKQRYKLSNIMYSHNDLSGNYKPLTQVLSDQSVPAWVRDKISEEFSDLI